MTEYEFKIALDELYRREGTQKRLAELAGITQSTINAYLQGKAKIENMPLGVFIRLFRNMRIDFFGDSTGDNGVDRCRKMLLSVFDKLSPDDQLRCLSIVIANFPDQVKEGAEK